MTTTRELAEQFSEKARACYEHDHQVLPMVWLISSDDRGLGLMVNGDEHPTDEFGILIGIGVRFMDVHWIVSVVEAWMKKATTKEEMERDYRRGDMARAEAAGDPTVQTAVVCSVIEVKEGKPTGSWAMCVPTQDDDGTIGWNNRFVDGEIEGALPETMLGAALAARQISNDDMPSWFHRHWGDLEFWAKGLVEQGLVRAAIGFEPRQ